MTFRRPQPSDTMTDHAEQHGFIYDEVSKLQDDKADIDHTHDGIGNDYDDSWIEPELNKKSDITHTHSSYSDLNHTHDTSHTHTEYQPKGDYASDTHTHPPQDLTHNHDSEYASDTHTHDTTHDHFGQYAGKAEFDAHHHDGEYAPVHNHPYVNRNANTDIQPNENNPFVTLKSRRFRENNAPTNREFGLQIDLAEGNTYKNQFQVTTGYGYALKVLGGSGKETWLGGPLTQKGNALENNDARDYIIRKNLTDATAGLASRTELATLKSAVESLQDAVAEIKEALKLPK